MLFAALLLAASPQGPTPSAPIRAVVLTGANNHEWQWTAPELASSLTETGRFEVRVVEPNDFKAYIDQRNAGKTKAEALAANNQPPLATTTHPFDTRRGEQAPQASK